MPINYSNVMIASRQQQQRRRVTHGRTLLVDFLSGVVIVVVVVDFLSGGLAHVQQGPVQSRMTSLATDELGTRAHSKVTARFNEKGPGVLIYPLSQQGPKSTIRLLQPVYTAGAGKAKTLVVPGALEPGWPTTTRDPSRDKAQ